MSESKLPPLKMELKKAIGVSLIASLCYALMLAFTKESSGIFSTAQLVFYRSFICLVIMGFWIVVNGKKKPLFQHLKTAYLKIQFIRSMAGLTALALFFFALRSITLSEASVLFNTTPIFVPITAYLWKRIPIDHRLWVGIGVAFMGVILIMQPETAHLEVGLWLALMGGAMGSVSTLALRFSHYTEPTSRTLFYYFVFGSAVSSIPLLWEGMGIEWLKDPRTLFFLLMVGVTGFLYQLFFALSVKYAPAKLISPFFYITVVFGMILDHIFWGAHFHFLEILGIVFVFLGVCLVVLLYPKNKK